MIHPENNKVSSAARSVQGGSDGSDGTVDGLEGSALESVGLGEFDSKSSVLDHLGTAQVGVVDHAGSDDLDGVLGGAMTSSHLHVHLGDGTADGAVSVLLVHVHRSCAGQVSQNNAVVSDAAGLSLEDLGGGDDLTLDLADLVLTFHEVPELRPGEDGVAAEHAHSVECWVRVRLSGEASAHNVELSQLWKSMERRVSITDHACKTWGHW